MNIFIKYIKQLHWELLVNGLAASRIMAPGLRNIIYRSCGMNNNAWKIRHNCYFESKWVTIGKGSYINARCNFQGAVNIGENTFIAMNVLFMAVTHEMGDSSKRAGKMLFKEITIGNGCWIGGGASVLPGVSIGNGCVIAAGSVVTKDCKPNGLYAGVPAKRIKDLDQTMS